MSQRDVIRETIPRERDRLVRDLELLSAEDWERPSLCDGWRVRDVVAHLIRSDEAYRRGYPLVGDLVRGGFRSRAALKKAAVRRSTGRTPDELVRALAATKYEVAIRIHPMPAVPLGEILIHGQDIRRALGRTSDIPPESFAVAAKGALSVARYFFGWGRPPKGVRFEASDTDWSIGRGALACGPIEAITMVLAGRRAALDSLDGPGVAALRSVAA
jgi:uncharacterized protein (TIGR03083 family)